MTDSPHVSIWAIPALSAAACLLTFLPSWLVLHFGDFRRERHWSGNARPVFTARSIVSVQLFVLTTPVLVMCVLYVPSLVTRIVALLAVISGWYTATWLVGRVMKRQHDFPKPVTAFEAERYLLVSLSAWGALLLPLVTYGLHLGVRIAASVVAAVATVTSIKAYTALLRLVGLLEPLPEYLTKTIRNQAPGVHCTALRSIQANAMALPFEKTVLFTTGALQRLSPEGLIAVGYHELSHLREETSVKFLRALPRVLALALVVTISLTPPDRAMVGFIVLFAAVPVSRFVLRRVSLTKERIADRTAHAREQNEGDYARALLALHEAFLIPAVLPRRSTHPSLYDRMKSAGVVPDFPPPPAPSSTPVLWTVMISTPIILAIAYAVLGG